MFRAYFLKSDGTCQTFESLDALVKDGAPDYSVAWVDIQAGSASDLAPLQEMFKLEPDAVEDCLSGEQRPRMDEFSEQVFFLLYGAVGREGEEGFSPRKLSIFLASNVIVSVHQEALRTIDRLRKRAELRGSALLERGAGYLLFSIVDSLVDNFLVVAETYDDKVEILEEESLDPNVEASILEECSDLRREMLGLRKIAVSMHEALQPVLGGEVDHVPTELEWRFAHVRDHITKSVETIDVQRELLHGVRDNYHAALANRMNRVVQTLTVFATIFLPLTLVAGIYGMNTPLWPSANEPWSFWFVLGMMVVIGVLMYAYFRIRRMI